MHSGGVALIGLSAFGTAQAATFTNFADFQAATTGLTTIDFEGLVTPDSTLGAEYIISGQPKTIGEITFIPSVVGNYAVIVDREPGDLLDRGSGATLEIPYQPSTITAALPSGITAFGVDLFEYNQNTPYTISFSTGESFNFTAPTFFGFTSDTPFSSVSIFSDNDGQVLDNFSFGQATPEPVPEPASILGTLAFAALGGKKLLKRKQEKTA